ncbi:hypothetical protein KC19_2G101800, partial [Ceratodon purpureus]
MLIFHVQSFHTTLTLVPPPSRFSQSDLLLSHTSGHNPPYPLNCRIAGLEAIVGKWFAQPPFCNPPQTLHSCR